MNWPSWNDVIAHLHDIDGLSTNTLVFLVVVFVLALAGGLIFLRLILQYSHEGVGLLLPLIQGALKALASEKTNDHPAIKVERRLHYLFALILLLSLVAILLHSLVPVIG